MVTDKELLTQSLEKFAISTTSTLFGISSLPAKTLIKYGVRNMIDKYGYVLDIFTTKSGTIDIPMLLGALKSEIKERGGFEFWNIKFTDSDLDEILSIYNELRKNNV